LIDWMVADDFAVAGAFPVERAMDSSLMGSFSPVAAAQLFPIPGKDVRFLR
jgi:hypothetical protein